MRNALHSQQLRVLPIDWAKVAALQAWHAGFRLVRCQ